MKKALETLRAFVNEGGITVHSPEGSPAPCISTTLLPTGDMLTCVAVNALRGDSRPEIEELFAGHWPRVRKKADALAALTTFLLQVLPLAAVGSVFVYFSRGDITALSKELTLSAAMITAKLVLAWITWFFLRLALRRLLRRWLFPADESAGSVGKIPWLRRG